MGEPPSEWLWSGNNRTPLRIRESDGEALSRFRPLEKINGTITSWLAYCPAPFGELELKERGVTVLPD